jgi:hypothetical protein
MVLGQEPGSVRPTDRVERVDHGESGGTVVPDYLAGSSRPATPNSAARVALGGLAAAADKYEEAPHDEVRLGACGRGGH